MNSLVSLSFDNSRNFVSITSYPWVSSLILFVYFFACWIGLILDAKSFHVQMLQYEFLNDKVMFCLFGFPNTVTAMHLVKLIASTSFHLPHNPYSNFSNYLEDVFLQSGLCALWVHKIHTLYFSFVCNKYGNVWLVTWNIYFFFPFYLKAERLDYSGKDEYKLPSRSLTQ